MTKPTTLFSRGADEVHIPGAGTLGMYLLLCSLGALFAASVLGYLLIRFGHPGGQSWPPPGFPPLPRTLWASTLVILATSVAIQWGLGAIRQGRARTLATALQLTFGLGAAFLLLQTLNWVQVFRALAPEQRGGPYIGLFFVLTALHAAHVVGGVIPLPLVLRRARAGVYSANYHPGVRYAAIYWHFLDAVWVLLFVVLYLL